MAFRDMNDKLLKIVLLIIISYVFACQDKKWDVDTSSIDLDLNFQRFDLDLWKAAEGGIDEAEVKELEAAYPAFYFLYCEGIMQFNKFNQGSNTEVINDFVANKDIRELFETIEKKFPRGSLIKELIELENGLKKYHYHFPELIVPEVKSMISAFSYSTVTSDSLLVIGLDNYLGSDFKLYPAIGLPEYKFEKFDRKYMVSDALKAWLTTEFESIDNQNLLEKMIFSGKILYLMKVMLVDQKPWIKFSYTEEELSWCEENESEIWFHFVDMELLFSSENFNIRKYLGDAPFITGFPEGSPGKVGQWVGYKIVNSYMESHPEVSLIELMKTESGNQFLQESNYKPKRK